MDQGSNCGKEKQPEETAQCYEEIASQKRVHKFGGGLVMKIVIAAMFLMLLSGVIAAVAMSLS